MSPTPSAPSVLGRNVRFFVVLSIAWGLMLAATSALMLGVMPSVLRGTPLVLVELATLFVGLVSFGFGMALLVADQRSVHPPLALLLAAAIHHGVLGGLVLPIVDGVVPRSSMQEAVDVESLCLGRGAAGQVLALWLPAWVLGAAFWQAYRAGRRARTLDARSRLLLGYALRAHGTGPNHVLFAVLGDPHWSRVLDEQGLDLATLETSVARPRLPVAVRIDPGDTDFIASLPSSVGRRVDMGHITTAAVAMPELRERWDAARRARSRATPPADHRLHLTNDDETPFDFVVEQLVTHGGCHELHALRGVVRCHVDGEATVAVARPASEVVQRLRDAARSAGHPLTIREG
ncbi:MAG: ATP-dependent Clp protease adaptor ClpS [Myxococcota bacterium]